MPGPWRLARNGLFVLCNDNFNLRRDARPLATMAAQHGLDLIIVISISDEMPGPWRPYAILQRHSKIGGFQSQTRCQAPGDIDQGTLNQGEFPISISDEMPGPWRHFAGRLCTGSYLSFNLSNN